MEEIDLIIIETAKLAKELDFAWAVNKYFVKYLKTHKSDNPSFAMKKGEIELESGYFSNNKSDRSNESYICYAAPTQAMLQKWLRDEHKIDIEVPKLEEGYSYHVYRTPKEFSGSLMKLFGEERKNHVYEKYEEALEKALQEALKILQNEKGNNSQTEG